MNLNIKETGQRIKAVRKQRHLTQEKLAELADVSPHYIYEIEAGLKSMSIHIFAALTNALHVSADYLLFGDDTKELEMTFPAGQDHLEYLISLLTASQRSQVADILTVLIPHLRDE